MKTKGIRKIIAVSVVMALAFWAFPAAAFAAEYQVVFDVVNDGNGNDNGTLTANVGRQTITSGQAVEEGSNIRFTATPEDGYKVKEWKVNNRVADNSSNTYTLRDLKAGASVTVEFEKKSVTAPVEFGVVKGNGSLEAKVDGNAITSGQQVEKGKSVQFTADPKNGYQVKEWKVNGNVVANNKSNTYILTNLQDAAKVTVEYVLKNNKDRGGKQDKVQQTIFVNVLWHDNDYGDWKNYRPSYLVFMLEAYDKDGGWTQAVTCNSANYGFRWKANWSFTQTAMIPQRYIDNSAYTLSGPVNPPAGYDFKIVQNTQTTWTVTAKLNPNQVKTTTATTTFTPKVPISGF